MSENKNKPLTALKFHFWRFVGIVLLGVDLFILAAMQNPQYYQWQHIIPEYFLALIGAAIFLSMEKKET